MGPMRVSGTQGPPATWIFSYPAIVSDILSLVVNVDSILAKTWDTERHWDSVGVLALMIGEVLWSSLLNDHQSGIILPWHMMCTAATRCKHLMVWNGSSTRMNKSPVSGAYKTHC